MMGDKVMRKYLLLTLVTIAVLFAGCATTEKQSESGEPSAPRGGASGY